MTGLLVRVIIPPYKKRLTRLETSLWMDSLLLPAVLPLPARVSSATCPTRSSTTSPTAGTTR